MCRIELEHTERSAEVRAVEVPGCRDCAYRFDAHRHGHGVMNPGFSCVVLLLGFGGCALGTLAQSTPLAAVGLVLLAASAVTALAERVRERRRRPNRPRGRQWTYRARRHPSIAPLLAEGWQLREYPPEPSG